VSKEEFEALDADGRIWWGENGNNIPRIKRFFSEVRQGAVPQTIWLHEEVGHTQEAKKELLENVEFESSESVFDTPKPTRLIMRMLRLATNVEGGDIVLDFFAGSGATGEAVWKLNLEDGGDRRFILVQLPEPTGYNDYATVADITKTRLRNAGEALAGGGAIPERALGFRTFELGASNFKLWDSAEVSADEEKLGEQLMVFAESVLDGVSDEDLLFEITLKSGIVLSAEVEPLPDGKTFAVEGGLIVSLAEPVTEELVDAIAERDPDRVVFLDRGFASDADRANAAIRLRKAGIEVRVV
jgi:adenine-specific DNA-methyltransferase